MTQNKTNQLEFIELVHGSQGILYLICAVYAGDKESRNDLRQEILLQLWNSHSTFRKQSSFSTWMYRVALNTALMYRRKQKRRRLTVPIDDIPHPHAEDHRDGYDEEVQILYQCIQELPKLDRAIVLMHLEQKSYKEISEITGLTQSNVSVRIVRIKQKLKIMLAERGCKGEKQHE